MPLTDISTAVSLLVPADWEDMQGKSQYSLHLLGSIEKVLATQGYSLKLVRLRDNETDSDLESFEEHLAKDEPAAIIVARVLQQDPVLDLLRSRAIPFVIFGHNPGSNRDAWVDVDNVGALWLTTRKCIDLGHQRIALLNGPAEHSYACQRAKGYRRALDLGGISLDSDLILNGQPTFAMGSVMASYLMRHENPPTALVCATDEMALGAMYACLDLGLIPGSDISIVGYGASEAGATSAPSLASVKFDLRRVGALLAEQLLIQLSPRIQRKRPTHQLLPVEWIEGGSLGEPPASPVFQVDPESRLHPGDLAQANAALHRTQQVVHAGSWRFNPLSQRFEGSPEFCSVLGLARDSSLVFGDLLWLVAASDVKRFERAWKRALNGRPFDVEVRFTVAGLERSLHWRGEFVCNCGELAYAEGAVQDVSEAAKVRAELEQARNDAMEANRAKDLFLANMSHEIRTPIHAILGLTDLLKRQEHSADASKTIDKISRSGSGLLNIINDILLISKVESKAMDIDDYSFDLQTLIDDLGATLDGLLSKKAAVSLSLPVVDPHWRYLRGDPARLSQILLNLLGNAAKFTSKGEVALEVEALPAERIANEVKLAFRVRDTGIGIAPERVDDLFTPFVQADNSISRSYGGTGLGLAIVDSLVRLMGGQVRVDSKPGAGSTFSFELSFETSQFREPHQRQHDKLKVLIVDDSPTCRLHAAQIVLELGWSATVVESGVEALTELMRSPEAYDLLLLDYTMPGMNGLEVARQVRSSAECSDITILMLSTTDESELDATLSHFIDGYIRKPLVAATLLETMAGEELVVVRETRAKPEVDRQLKGLQVFCVDDSDINLELLMDMLEHLGATVTTAMSGSEALGILEASPHFDLMLCDIQMPGMDGFELTKRVHALSNYSQLPVVGVSAGVASLRLPDALAAGMAGYLEKPFNQLQLVSAIDQVIKGRSRAPVESLKTSSNTLIFNPDLALKNWSRQESFVKQLRLFHQRYTDDQEIPEMIDSLRFEEALQYAHKLKGVAGVLGLEQFSDIAKRLELQLRSRGQTPDLLKLRGLAAQFSQAQRRARAEIEPWLAKQGSDDSDKHPQGQGPRISVEMLLDALQSHDPVAAERCLESDVEGLASEVLVEIREAVSGFDFPRAAMLLRSSLESRSDAGHNS